MCIIIIIIALIIFSTYPLTPTTLPIAVNLIWK